MYVLKKFLYALLLTPLVCLSQTDSVKIEDLNTIAFKILKVGEKPDFIAIDNDDAWIIDDQVSNYADNSVQKIDTRMNSVTATIPVGLKPRFLTAGGQYVWTLNQGDGTVSEIDPSSEKLLGTFDVKAVGEGGDIISNSNKVWIISTNPVRPVQVINTKTQKLEIIYRQNTNGQYPSKVDGAVRISRKYIWISGYYSKTVWIFKK